MPSKASLTDRIKAFNTGTMNVSKKVLTKRELEEQRKKEEEKETAKVFEDFVASFDEKTVTPKASFVRGSIINADSSGIKEIKNEKEGTLYQPQAKRSRASGSQSQARSNLEEIKREIEKRMLNEKAKKTKKEESRKKSNLEAFKEELKQMHEAREEHVKIKQQIETIEEKMRTRSGSLTSHEQKILSLKTQIAATEEIANVDVTDPNSTNLYCSNIHTDLLEEHLCKLFGRYGPLASVKIMYPRSDDEKSISTRRNTNCGFVAFMCRKDAENALKNLNGIEYKGITMSVTWGRVVPIPPQPAYVPARLRKMLMPPPPTKQPFNCLHPDIAQLSSVEEEEEDAKRLWEKHLEEACVKVCIPTDRNLLNLIHRMVEFVVREGPMFEALIMNRELNNPMFRFLFDNASPAHLYYRWKLFSVLQGDELQRWRTDTFRMFKNGPIWKPPPMNVYTQGMSSDVDSDELDEEDSGMLNSGLFIKPRHRQSSPESSRSSRRRAGGDSYTGRSGGQKSPKRGFLSMGNKSKLDDIVKDLTCAKTQIEIAMVFCLSHAECAEQIVRILVTKMEHTNQHSKRLAFLYLLNDLLHNSSAKVSNAASYRRYIEPNLCKVFQKLNESYSSLEGKFKQEQFKQKVMNCFRAWEQWTVYPEFLLIKLQNIFLGLEKLSGSNFNDPGNKSDGDESPDNSRTFSGIHGSGLINRPDDEADLDLDVLRDNENLDGIPLSKDGGDVSDDEFANEKDIDGNAFEPKSEPVSKWQQLVNEEEPEDTTLPVSTLSKWEKVDGSDEEEIGNNKFGCSDQNSFNDDIDGIPLDDKTDDDLALSNSSSKVEVQTPKRVTESDQISSTLTASQVLDALNLSDSEKRRVLREIEVKVMKYQDDIESGRRSKQSGLSIQQQLEQYRLGLAKKEKSTLSSGKASAMYESLSSGDDTSASSSTQKRKSKKRNRSQSKSSRSSADEAVESQESQKQSASKQSKRGKKSRKHQKKTSKSRSRSPNSRKKRSRSNSKDKSPEQHSSSHRSSRSSKSSRHA